MKELFFIGLCFLSTLAWGQVRPGTGPSPGTYTLEQLDKLVSSSVADNTSECSSPQKFKNIIEIYNFVSVKNVLAKGKSDCSELKPKVSAEVRCLFTGMPESFLHDLTGRGKDPFIEYLDKNHKLSEKEAAPVWEFYNHLDWSISNE